MVSCLISGDYLGNGLTHRSVEQSTGDAYTGKCVCVGGGGSQSVIIQNSMIMDHSG